MKLLLGGAVFGMFSGYYLNRVFFSGGTGLSVTLPFLIGLILMFVGGVAVALYALLSFIVNKCVFGTDTLTYRTLFKHIKVKYQDILHITTKRRTTIFTGRIYGGTQYTYKLVTKSGTIELNIFEFWGLAKQIDIISSKNNTKT
jgi:hypothetical protein